MTSETTSGLTIMAVQIYSTPIEEKTTFYLNLFVRAQ